MSIACLSHLGFLLPSRSESRASARITPAGARASEPFYASSKVRVTQQRCLIVTDYSGVIYGPRTSEVRRNDWRGGPARRGSTRTSLGLRLRWVAVPAPEARVYWVLAPDQERLPPQTVSIIVLLPGRF